MAVEAVVQVLEWLLGDQNCVSIYTTSTGPLDWDEPGSAC